MSEIKEGKYEKPKTDFSINLHSPKIILSERLLADKIIDQSDIATIIVDLGLIQAHTKLISQ